MMKVNPSGIKKTQKLLHFLHDVELGNFGKEESVERYFYENIRLMMKYIFNEDVSVAIRQKRIKGDYFGIRYKSGQIGRLSKCKARIDIYVECISGNVYAIEIKSPQQNKKKESIHAVSQLMYYQTLIPKINKLVILSTKYDDGLLEMINKFKLDIEFLLFSKKQIFQLKR